MAAALALLVVTVGVATLSAVDAKVIMVDNPVIYTNNRNKQGETNELHVPNNSVFTKEYNLPDKVRTGWYMPIDNIGDLAKIRSVDLTQDKKKLKLNLQGFEHSQDARVRIRIFADIND